MEDDPKGELDGFPVSELGGVRLVGGVKFMILMLDISIKYDGST